MKMTVLDSNELHAPVEKLGDILKEHPQFKKLMDEALHNKQLDQKVIVCS